MADVIEYNGVKYRKYPGKHYYFAAGGGESLHRQKWKDAHGEIPPGHDIHHKDENKENNSIENLEARPFTEHRREHTTTRLLHGDLGRILAVWRQTTEGQEILRQNAAKMHARTPERTLACAYCRKVFTTRHPFKRYCDKVCETAVPKLQLVLDCEICKKPFAAKRSAKKQVRTCSYSCGWALRRRNSGL